MSMQVHYGELPSWTKSVAPPNKKSECTPLPPQREDPWRLYLKLFRTMFKMGLTSMESLRNAKIAYDRHPRMVSGASWTSK